MKTKLRYHKLTQFKRFGFKGTINNTICLIVGHRLNEKEDYPWCERCKLCYEEVYFPKPVKFTNHCDKCVKEFTCLASKEGGGC